MPGTKSAAASAQKWATRAGSASTDYAEGAAGAGQKWQTQSAGAAATFKQAVSSGNIEARYSAGIQRSGAAKYTRKVTSVGASRYSGGVSDGRQDYETAIGPVLQTIAGVTLPVRKPRGDPANIARVSAITSALAARRLGATAAGR
jgi:hypothetical protein